MNWTLPIVLLCWEGTGVNMWTGPPIVTAQAAMAARPDIFYAQPVGNWTAALPPYMGIGVVNGLAEGKRLVSPGNQGDEHPTNFVIPIGYSIGSTIAALWWRWIIATGQQSRVPAAIRYGPPMRCPGKANGNAYAGWPIPAADHGGIAGPADLTPDETPDTHLDFVQMGDDNGATEIYGNWPVGSNPWTAETQSGRVATSIYNDATATWTGILDFFKILQDATLPVGVMQAIWTGFEFLGAQGAADHYNYPTDAAVRYLVDVVAPQFTQ